jgi:hypothetical protein
MSCRNPNTQISAEISETLETLGPKAKNPQNLFLRAPGDALEEALLFYAKNITNVQVLRDRTPHKGGSYEFFWKP